MADQAVQDRPTPSRGFFAYLIATAAVCGALVMVIEVMGSRVLGPFFGVSLFVWTALITVTLVALALGYAAGGMLSDRRSSPDYLYGIIVAAGVLALLVPVLKGPVLKAALPVGLRSGALLSSLILFGPSLFLLGAVSPYLVKIAAGEMAKIGRTVGALYAISTLGSFLGTVVTGFVLIAHFGTDRIFAVTGGILIVLGAGYFALFRRTYAVLIALLPVFLVPTGGTAVSKVMPDGTRATRLLNEDTFYGNLKVVDYTYGAIHTREMLIDGAIQGGIDVNTGLPIYGYFYFLEFLPYAVNPAGKSCLVIGLGAGLVPPWYERRGIATDVIDINPRVVDAARRYFDFRTSGDVIIADARYHLNRTDRRYDYIILDVFNGDTIPSHILSLEALQLVRRRLTERGVLAVNVIGSLRHDTLMTASVVRTMQAAFGTVELYPTFSPDEGEGFGNVVVLAYDFPPVPYRAETTRSFSIHPFARNAIDRMEAAPFRFPEGTPSRLLTDDDNPIDSHDVWLKEEMRKNILRTTDWDILL